MQDDEGPQRSPTLVIVPLTSQMHVKRFGHTVTLDPGGSSGLSVPSLAMAFQITATDRLNVIGQLGCLASDDYQRVASAVCGMIGYSETGSVTVSEDPASPSVTETSSAEPEA
jgi:mRNA-degrading endonuclease toxin of MazEF toxin-antitoxin module